MDFRESEKRIINWTIIKQIWFIYNKKSKEFETTFGFNHNFYYEIMKGEKVGLRNFDKISKSTNISLDVLTGRRIITLGKEEEFDWKRYLFLLNNPNIDNKNKIKEMREKVKIIIKTKHQNPVEGSDLFNILHFCKFKKKYEGKNLNILPNMIAIMNNRINWDELIKYEENDYKNYYDAIKKQYELLNAIDIYKKYNNDK